MARRRVLIDVSPLRESRDFRVLFTGQLVSFVGSQVALVAVQYQVYVLTGSSLQVGLVSLVQVAPLVAGSIVGGAVADAVDRRKLLLWMQVALAATSVGLAVNASVAEPAVWPLYLLTALSAGLSGFDRPARNAALPGLVPRASLPAAYALWQVLLQSGFLVGPALAGILLERFGLAFVYWFDAATFVAAFVAALLLPPLRPVGARGDVRAASVLEGFRFLRGSPVLVGTFAIDLAAMVFGLPRALFPALGTEVFGGDESTVGLLYAAPGAGAMVGALLTGWVGGVRSQGRAVLLAVAAWGAAIAAFGFVSWLPLGLALLAFGGAADMISAVFRNTILQQAVPDSLRGRVSAAHIAVVTGGPRLGDAEAGAVAALAGTRGSVVSGGLACIVGVVLVARLWPEVGRYRSEPAGEPEADDEAAG